MRFERKMKKNAPASIGLLTAGAERNYFMPNILPTLACRPALVVGTPVAFAILRFVLVIPSALLTLKSFFAIIKFPPMCSIVDIAHKYSIKGKEEKRNRKQAASA